MIILLSAIALFSLFATYLNGGKMAFLEGENDPRRKRCFCAFAATVWAGLSGLRHLSIGADTIAYEWSFNQSQYKSWEQIANNVFGTYQRVLFVKDPGYAAVEKAVYTLGGQYRTFLIIIAIFFFGVLGSWIYHNSRVPYVSFLLFSSLFYSFFAFTGHRQTIATALVVLIGDRLIRRRKLIPFFFLVLLSSTIHKSCVCFLPAYFVFPFRNYSRKTYIAATLAGLILLLFSTPLWRFVGEWLHYEDFLENDIGGTGTFVFLYFLVLIIAIVQFPQIVQNNTESYGIFNVLLLGSMTVAMSFVNQSFMRVQQYYTLYLMLLLPEIILSFKKQNRFLVATAGCGMLLFFYIMNKPDYMFFWQ